MNSYYCMISIDKPIHEDHKNTLSMVAFKKKKNKKNVIYILLRSLLIANCLHINKC